MDSKGDSDIVGEMRVPCYRDWSAYRDAEEADGDCANLTDFRTGFVSGWNARLSWVRVESPDDLPTEGRYLFTLLKVNGDTRIAVFNVTEKPWLGVKILAYMPLPEPATVATVATVTEPQPNPQTAATEPHSTPGLKG